MSISEPRTFINALELAKDVSSRLEMEEVSEKLVSKIIELYLEEKTKNLEAGNSIVEGNTAIRYQIRNYDKDAEGKNLYTVKIQAALGTAYRKKLKEMLTTNQNLLEVYSIRDSDQFMSQFNTYLLRNFLAQ